MKQEQMLMLIVAFLVGLFFKQLMGQVCGGRLIEGQDEQYDVFMSQLQNKM